MGEVQKRTEVFTYERLFEILRAEKNSPNLQKLDKTLPEQIANYLQEKDTQLAASIESDNVFASDDIETLQTQLRNARRIVRMIYDLREKKILQMALNKSRTASSIIDTSSLLESEITLFKDALEVLDKHRHEKLLPLVDVKKALPMDLHPNAKVRPATPVQTIPSSSPSSSSSSTRQDSKQGQDLPTKMLVRMLEDVPVLVGPDLREYGPYMPEDIANIPVEIGTALVDARKAQQITPKLPQQ